MYEYNASVVRVIDGDTVVLLIDLGLSVFVEHSCRLRDVDAAEIRGVERELGLRHKAILEGLLPQWKIGDRLRIRTYKGDKYGRYLFDAFVNEESLAATFKKLIQEHPE